MLSQSDHIWLMSEAEQFYSFYFISSKHMGTNNLFEWFMAFLGLRLLSTELPRGQNCHSGRFRCISFYRHEISFFHVHNLCSCWPLNLTSQIVILHLKEYRSTTSRSLHYIPLSSLQYDTFSLALIYILRVTLPCGAANDDGHVVKRVVGPFPACRVGPGPWWFASWQDRRAAWIDNCDQIHQSICLNVNKNKQNKRGESKE